MSKLVADILLLDKTDSVSLSSEESTKHRWRFAIDWGLHFLSAPVPIVDYSKLPNQSVPEFYMDSKDLAEEVKITTLWRVMTNYIEHLSPVGLMKLSAEIDD